MCCHWNQFLIVEHLWFGLVTLVAEDSLCQEDVKLSTLAYQSHLQKEILFGGTRSVVQ